MSGDENYRSAREARAKFEKKSVADVLTEMGAAGTPLVMDGQVVGMSFSMAGLKDALLGDESLDQLVAEKRCSKNVGCGKSLVKDDGSPVYVFDTREEAETYEMEFRRTGLCPTCLNQALDALSEGEPDEEPDEDAEPECNGICLSAADIGIPASGIAYAHPECPAHGES